MNGELLLPSIVFGPFIGAGITLALGRVLKRNAAAIMIIAAMLAFIQGLLLVNSPSSMFVREWLPGLNIALGLRGDPFGIFFSLLISGIGTLVGIYSWSYIHDLPGARLSRYYAALQAFMGAMLGVALSDNLILLFIFWEITSISSFMLIGFWYEQEKARKGALTALQVTALGGLVMMIGIIMLGLITGSFSLQELYKPELQAKLTASPLFVPALLLILVGALTKSAQWPFHFWLPGAMVAPTPVSTYLHAATMVKAGIFLLGRMFPLFHSSPMWANILVPIGLLTFLWGAMSAFVEDDLKGILAKTTLSALGLLTMLYGIGAPGQDALQILTHATYKGALFLTVGIIEHATHTRHIHDLGGLRAKMPITFIICLLAAASMMGIPPFFGFVAKESLYAMLLDNIVPAHGAHPSLTGGYVPLDAVLGITVLANAFIFAVGCRIVFRVFFGKGGSHTHHAHDAPLALWLPPAVLASLALGFGVITNVSEIIANGFSSAPAHLHLALIPSHIEPVLLSLVTVALGIAIFLTEKMALHWRDNFKAIKMQQIWNGMLDLITRSAVAYSMRWQSGSLSWYLAGTLTFAIAVSWLALWHDAITAQPVPINLQNAVWYGVVICMFLVVSSVLVVKSTTRLAAAIALTTNGFLTSLLFVVYRSPDILLTQILIETVSTVFLLLILFYMPVFQNDNFSPLKRLVNILISFAVGFTMFIYIMLSTSPQFHTSKNLAADYFAHSLADAGGANAVNVIIVDLRAIDTNGEITVLVMVGLIAFGLLNARRRKSA